MSWVSPIAVGFVDEFLCLGTQLELERALIQVALGFFLFPSRHPVKHWSVSALSDLFWEVLAFSFFPGFLCYLL